MPTINNLTVSGSLIVSGTMILHSGSAFQGSGSFTGSFSGSYIGNGAGLTGITAANWNGIRSGSAGITGSLTVISGSTSLQGVTVGSTLTISTGSATSAKVEIFHYTTSSLSGVTTLMTFPISASAGYAGFKADYVLTTPNEIEKKVGTLLGSWDRSGNADISDNYVSATGDAIQSVFSLDASSSTSASLSVNAVGGNFEINMLVTAFKRPV
jgi:hypothetical protein